MSSFLTPQIASGLCLEFISAEENEFLAKETLIVITSGVSHEQFHFLSGKFGPLEAGLPCQVPLWFALQLRRNGKCIIEIPEWLTVASLEKTKDDEKVKEGLTDLPYYFVEIAQLLLAHAKDDFDSPDQTRTLLQDIQGIRMDRLRTGVLTFADLAKAGEGIPSVKLPNICASEVLGLRGFVSQSLGMFKRLVEQTGSASSSSSTGGGVLGAGGSGGGGGGGGGSGGGSGSGGGGGAGGSGFGGGGRGERLGGGSGSGSATGSLLRPLRRFKGDEA